MRLFGLIGFPLSHSFSAAYFAEKFRQQGITDARYDLYPISDINQLKNLINDNHELIGLNVTIPYKQQVLPFLSESDEAVRETGATNTIKIVREGPEPVVIGYNTDVYGFAGSLKPLITSPPGNKKALVLGTGGASRAVEWVLKRLGFVVIQVSRKPSRQGQISYEQISAALMEETKIIVNTSPLGMYPVVDDFPRIPYRYVTPEHILYDLIYNPEETVFLKKGKERGAVIKNGLQMLQLQADKSWEIWNK